MTEKDSCSCPASALSGGNFTSVVIHGKDIPVCRGQGVSCTLGWPQIHNVIETVLQL